MGNSNAIVPGSVSAIQKSSGKSLAEVIADCVAVVLIDISGSMSSELIRNGEETTRYNIACEELKKIQATFPGKILVIQFSDDAEFRLNGLPSNPGGQTNLHGALKFAKVVDAPGVKFFVISDGEPDNEYEAIQIAKTYANVINTIFVGPEDNVDARKFLVKLSAASGGKSMLAAEALGLADKVTLLLGAGK